MKRSSSESSSASKKSKNLPSYDFYIPIPLDHPTDIKFNSRGNMIFTDSYNSRVCIVIDQKVYVLAGSKDGSITSKFAKDIYLDNPKRLFLDNDDIYVSTKTKIYKIHPNGFISEVYIQTPPKSIDGLIYSDGNYIISDSESNQIKLIDARGCVSVIAGSGHPGFANGSDEATEAKFSRPRDVILTKNGTYVFSVEGRVFELDDSDNSLTAIFANNERVRYRISKYNDSFIATNGEKIFLDSRILAAKLWFMPECLTVSPRGDLICTTSDSINLLKENELVTLLGNDTEGYSELPFVEYPSFHLIKKYDRDLIHGSNITGFLPLITLQSPQFSETILKTDLIKQLDEQVIQFLIDGLIYRKNHKSYVNDSLSILCVLGLFRGGEFVELKRSNALDVTASLTVENIHTKMELIEKLKEQFPSNYILEMLFNYCIEFSGSILKTTDQILEHAIILKYLPQIASKVKLPHPTPLAINEDSFKPVSMLKTLFNDKATSDIKIQIGSVDYYCHRTVLASKSTYFEALFNSGIEYQDLTNNTHVMQTEEFGEEIILVIVKYCYGIFEIDMKPNLIIPLLKCTIFHEMDDLIEYCVDIFSVTTTSFFPIIEQLRPVIESDNPHISAIVEKIISFGFENRRKIFTSEQQIANLPEKIRNAYIFKLLVA